MGISMQQHQDVSYRLINIRLRESVRMQIVRPYADSIEGWESEGAKLRAGVVPKSPIAP